MSTKKTEEVMPVGSVPVESVRNLEGFDPFAQIPEVATWRDFSEDALAESEKANTKPAAKKES